MKLIFYSIVLNNHQAMVADEFWGILGDKYRFVELVKPNKENAKGGTEDYSSRPYLIQAWASEEAWKEAMHLACTAECCVFSGLPALPFAKVRMKKGLLSFDMSERWLKRGGLNVLSSTISKMCLAYWFGGWRNKPIYKLCNGAYVARDQYKLNTYKGKCYKWGYFTRVDNRDVEASPDVSTSNITPLMWCSRYLMWKHPELAVRMAQRLKQEGYRFVLDFYGSGEFERKTRDMVASLGLDDVVRFHGAISNERVLQEMRRHKIFLFTSDRYEGWGAVANEAMSQGCALVGSDAIGSIPYLVEHRRNGMVFKSGDVNSLTECVKELLDNPSLLESIRNEAVRTMQTLWSPAVAARNLLELIDDLQNGRSCSIEEGPCSKA